MNATHVPYRGAAPAATDTVAGVVDFYVATFPTVAALIRDGRLRALSVGAPRRLADFPDIPTAEEAGVPFMAVDAWFGLFAPPGLPRAQAERLGPRIPRDAGGRRGAAGPGGRRLHPRAHGPRAISPPSSAPRSRAGPRWFSSPG
jgi:hypothetical protein